MGSRVKSTTTPKKSTRRPSTSPEARENRLISLAYDLAEKRLLEGTASAQEVTTLLKQGSQKAREELEKLRTENDLMRAKIEALEAAKNYGADFERVISAMQAYSGNSTEYYEEEIVE